MVLTSIYLLSEKCELNFCIFIMKDNRFILYLIGSIYTKEINKFYQYKGSFYTNIFILKN